MSCCVLQFCDGKHNSNTFVGIDFSYMENSASVPWGEVDGPGKHGWYASLQMPA